MYDPFPAVGEARRGHRGSLDRFSRPLADLAGRATRPDTVKNALSGTWLGHQLHPMLTDLPIGAWVMAAILDWTTGRSGATAARRLVGVGVLAARQRQLQEHRTVRDLRR